MQNWISRIFSGKNPDEDLRESWRRDERFTRRHAAGKFEILPGLGDQIVSAIVTKVHVEPGQVVGKDHPLIEVETDKAAMNVPASRSMKIIEVAVRENDILAVGQIIASIETID